MRFVCLSVRSGVTARAFRMLSLGLALLLSTSVHHGLWAAPQEPQQPEPKPAGTPEKSNSQQAAGPPTPLAALVEEARKSDPHILAAEQAAKAAGHVAPQLSTLPDPQFTIQHFSVGSPRPFAGYTNSDFAYIGLGASQELPYPGKLRLRGEVANREADALKERAEAIRREEIEKLKAAYFRLAYLQQVLVVLQRDGILLQQIEQQAESRYRVGKGNQQDVFRAQLERTKILREISMQRQDVGRVQTEMKRILRRPQDSPDIITEPLSATSLPYTPAELLERVREQNPDVREQSAMVRRDQTAVDLAHKEFLPDFGLSYMYQHTSSNFRDYYMLTFDVKFPRRRRRAAALAEAQENLKRVQHDMDAQVQSARADVQQQYVVTQTSEEQLRIYRGGLIPQAQAALQAGMAAYESNRADFQTLLSSFLDVLKLELEYTQTLLDHETALVRIERLTGVTLP
jgi:cobalt-zinc-cadmium efflux system outer membrane protein